MTRTYGTSIPIASQVKVLRVTGSTLDDVQDMITAFNSAGRIDGGSVTDAGSATVDIAAGVGTLRGTDDHDADLYFIDWAASSGVSIPTDTTRYIGVEWNAGSPQLVVKTSNTWDTHTDFVLAVIVNESDTLHIENVPHFVANPIGHALDRFYQTDRLSRDDVGGGLILGETGTRNITITAGALWDRLTRFSISAIDTSGADTFDRYYRDGAGGFTAQSAQTQWDNTQYDDGSGTIATMTNNWYSSQYFYVEPDGGLVSQYGRAQYPTFAGAENDTVPNTAPERINVHAKLIGRIVFQKNGATALAIESVFDTTFTTSGVTDHGELGGLSDDDHTQYLLADGTRALGGAWDMGNQALTNVNADTGNIANAVANTEWDAAFTHVSSDGSDHTFINQDVTTGGAPLFKNVMSTYYEVGPGAANVDGNWKAEVVGTDLVFYRRESSVWVQKYAITA